MAVTGLRIENEEGINNMLVSTVPFSEPDESGTVISGVAVTWQAVNDDLSPNGKPEVTAHEGTELGFHTQLRHGASLQEHLVTNWSSNPEWNPEGYEKIINLN
jgi:hypothetical protein